MELEEVEALKAKEENQTNEDKGKGKIEEEVESTSSINKKKTNKPQKATGTVKLTQLWKYASNFQLFLVLYV